MSANPIGAPAPSPPAIKQNRTFLLLLAGNTISCWGLWPARWPTAPIGAG